MCIEAAGQSASPFVTELPPILCVAPLPLFQFDPLNALGDCQGLNGLQRFSHVRKTPRPQPSSPSLPAASVPVFIAITRSQDGKTRTQHCEKKKPPPTGTKRYA